MTEVSNHTAGSTREVIERLREAMENNRKRDFIAQFAEDAVYETPWVLAGQPSRWEGFAAISEHLGADNPTRNLLDFTRVSVNVHPAADPDEATVQFIVDGKVLATGETFVLPSSLGIIRVRHGKIVHYTDYTNILRGAQVAGVLKQFGETLASM